MPISEKRDHLWLGGPRGLNVMGKLTGGRVLPAAAQTPARLVYGSAALAASLRGQQSHLATLPITDSMSTRQATPPMDKDEPAVADGESRGVFADECNRWIGSAPVLVCGSRPDGSYATGRLGRAIYSQYAVG